MSCIDASKIKAYHQRQNHGVSIPRFAIRKMANGGRASLDRDIEVMKEALSDERLTPQERKDLTLAIARAKLRQQPSAGSVKSSDKSKPSMVKKAIEQNQPSGQSAEEVIESLKAQSKNRKTRNR